MEISRPSKQRNNVRFDSVGIADIGSCCDARSASWQHGPSSVPSSSLQSPGDSRTSPAECSSDHSGHVDHAGVSSRRKRISSDIAEAVVGHIKRQLDGMMAVLMHETERLLQSDNFASQVASWTRSASTPSMPPEYSEEKLAAHSFSSQADSSGPDASSLPMPMWMQRPVHPTVDAIPPAGPPDLLEQPQLPSVVEDNAFARQATPFPGQTSLHDSESQSVTSIRRVVLANSVMQREMQRAAVTAAVSRCRLQSTDFVVDEKSSHLALESLRGRSFPQSVSGAWRRQASILGRMFREQMADEVAMAKSNMSFRGGLWWLRHITGVRSLSAPRKAACISACNVSVMLIFASLHLQLMATMPASMLSSFLDLAMVFSGFTGLTIHHICSKLSESCPTTGEQDAMLQSHSIAFDYTSEWLASSRKHGWWLLCICLGSIATACASYVYKAQALHQDSQSLYIVTGCSLFMISSATICALSMRVAHICSAMKVAVISFMQKFAEAPMDFDEMVQEWNAVQIFARTLSDGCAPSLVFQVAMIPMMLGSALLQILLMGTNFLELFITVVPFFMLSGMPYFALMCAADTSMQCGHAAPVANSLLVGQLGNPVAQNLLDFMSRSKLGFFINDLRISPAGVMKYTYVLVGIFVTVASSVIEREV